MTIPFRLLTTLAIAFALAGCSTNGGSSSVPATFGKSAAHAREVPAWQAHHLARPACARAARGRAQCLALVESGLADTYSGGWTPSDFQAAYNLPSGTKGKGQIVAIVDAYDNPDVASDLAAYRSTFGLGKAKFKKFNEYGQQKNYPPGDSGWGVEIDLDVEMVSAVCPACTIYLIEASSAYSNNDLSVAEAEAVTLGAHVVSNSWICYPSSCSVDAGDFKTPGVAYLAGSGDAGYNENGPPEALGNVISVGGTVLSKTGSTYSEVVWDGSGGGCATGNTKPVWQHDPDCTSRTDADVSAVAWDVAEYDSYDESGWFTVGGTSVATPLTSGIVALAGNARKSHAAKKFWAMKTAERKKDMHYISSGTDGYCGGEYLCTAGTDQFGTYSGPSGWGTANGIDAY
ncbi:MAG TPA: S8 family serine peptidase [Candidatus Cybelea sp.]|nr:S8 family serine peptidase [Candidatus Cybelea sp.]